MTRALVVDDDARNLYLLKVRKLERKIEEANTRTRTWPRPARPPRAPPR